jgi:hypothetical protein
VGKKKPLGSATISKKKLERHRCLDCGVNVIKIGEYYMVNSEIWTDQLDLEWYDNLCIGCLEKRLGRKLQNEPPVLDFSYLPQYEWLRQYPLSERLADRYGFEKGKTGKGQWKGSVKPRRRRASTKK